MAEIQKKTLILLYLMMGVLFSPSSAPPFDSDLPFELRAYSADTLCRYVSTFLEPFEQAQRESIEQVILGSSKGDRTHGDQEWIEESLEIIRLFAHFPHEILTVVKQMRTKEDLMQCLVGVRHPESEDTFQWKRSWWRFTLPTPVYMRSHLIKILLEAAHKKTLDTLFTYYDRWVDPGSSWMERVYTLELLAPMDQEGPFLHDLENFLGSPGDVWLLRNLGKLDAKKRQDLLRGIDMFRFPGADYEMRLALVCHLWRRFLEAPWMIGSIILFRKANTIFDQLSLEYTSDHPLYGPRLLDLIATPWTEPFPPLSPSVYRGLLSDGVCQDPEVGCERGRNVYVLTREKRVLAALDLLSQYVTVEKQDKAFEDFIRHLDTVEKKICDEIMRVLWGRSKDPYPGLCESETFTLLGTQVHGKILIARLWKFINARPHANDRKDLTQNMMRALTGAFEDGAPVCNKAKTEALVVALLQGRLEGVSIDEGLPPIPMGDAMTLFFMKYKDLRFATDKDLIRSKVSVFCEENPDLDKKEFNASMDSYLHFV